MGAENIINSNDLDLNSHREELISAIESIASWADLVSSLAAGIQRSMIDRESESLARSIESTIAILGATADDLNRRILKGMPFKDSTHHWLADIAPYYRKIASGNESA